MLKSNSQTVKKFRFQTDRGTGVNARIGLMVLQTDQTLEAEMAQFTAIGGVALYHARLHNDEIVTPESLTKMEIELPGAAELLAPSLNLSSIGYGCTSGSTMIGEKRVAQILEQVHPGVPSSNPLTAAKAAFSALKVGSIGLLTPYTPDVTRAMQRNFVDSGFEIPLVGSFYEDNDLNVGKISEESILDATISIGKNSRCAGVFISCTSLRSAGVIEKAEVAIGKPVTASNHALAWHLLRLAGIKNQLDGYGTLLSEC